MEIKSDILVKEWSEKLISAYLKKYENKIDSCTEGITDFKCPHNPLSLAMTSNNDALIHMVIRTLILFSKLKYEDIVEILIKHGCPISRIITDIFSNTKIVELLIERGVDIKGCINKKDSFGNMILHKAARDIRLNLVDILLRNGADLDAVNTDNLTPLHYALKKKQSKNFLYCDKLTYQKKVRIAWTLTRRGANLEIKSKDKMSSWDFLLQTMIFNFYANYENTSQILSFFYGYGDPQNSAISLASILPASYNNKFRKFYLSDSRKCILRQLIKLDDQHTGCVKPSERVLEKYAIFIEDSKAELENMKHEILKEVVTLYSILTVHSDTLLRYVFNYDIRKAFKNVKIKEKYPNYAHDLETRFYFMNERRVLMENAKKYLNKTLCFSLPIDIVEVIARHLDLNYMNNIYKLPEFKDFMNS